MNEGKVARIIVTGGVAVRVMGDPQTIAENFTTARGPQRFEDPGDGREKYVLADCVLYVEDEPEEATS